jgi:hypothetical protein
VDLEDAEGMGGSMTLQFIKWGGGPWLDEEGRVGLQDFTVRIEEGMGIVGC